jgi:hypothetical protein
MVSDEGLVGQAMPYLRAAIGAYGAAVLSTAEQSGDDKTVRVGRELLVSVYRGLKRRPRADFRLRLADMSRSQPDGGAMAALGSELFRILSADHAARDEFASILRSAPEAGGLAAHRQVTVLGSAFIATSGDIGSVTFTGDQRA